MKVTWIDRWREPQEPPNPDYPNGIDLDLSQGAGTGFTCAVDLPYPARRIGFYLIDCEICGQKLVVTTAGRPDDPRSVKIACNPHLN